MKRTFKYALSAVLATAMVVPAFADNFPDVPDNHWAYEALARMKKEGLLIGYPDGLYRGSRLATRYELAVACHAVYVALKNVSDAMDTRIKALEDAQGHGGNPGSGDLDTLKSQVAALRSDVDAMKGWGQDIADLKRFADQFQKELSSMGVDVEAMKTSLRNLDARVTALEGKKMPVNISGDVNFVGLGGYSQSGDNGITVDGRPTGVGRGRYAGTTPGGSIQVGALNDLTVLHEAAIKLTSNNDTGPKWQGTFVMGNMLGGGAFVPGQYQGAAFGDQVNPFAGVPFAEGRQDFYVQDLFVKFDTSIAKQGFNATGGRMPIKIAPYILQRPDNTPYFDNERWDNGNYYIDGGSAGFSFGRIGVDVMLGRPNSQSVNGVMVDPLMAGRLPGAIANFGGDRPRGFANVGALNIATVMGANAHAALGDKGGLNLSYLWLMSNDPGIANRVEVYGADANFQAGMFALKGGYSKSQLKYNNSNVGPTTNNDAWYVDAGLAGNKWHAKVGYREINPLFGAPGDWGRIGIWWNPTDIKGAYGDLKYDLNSTVKLHANGGIYSGTGKVAGGFATNDKLNHFNIDATFQFAPMSSLMLGYEWVGWDLKTASVGKPRENWYNIGLGFDLSTNSKLSFLWQISDYDAKGTAGWNPFNAGVSGATAAKGGLITTQLSCKF